MDHLLDKLNIYCYASLKNQDFTYQRNMILDEVHNLTPARLPFVEKLVGNNGLITLSATVPGHKKKLLNKLGITTKNTVSYSLDEGVADNLTTDYRILVVELALDTTTKNIQVGRKGAYYFVTEQKAYEMKNNTFKMALRSRNQGFIKAAMLGRMRFLYDLPSKQMAMQEILKYIPTDKKALIFTGSVNQANAICQHRYHYKTDDIDLERFKKGEILRLSAVNAIAEGQNIPDLYYALIQQCLEEELHSIQKIGRLVRKTDDPNKIGRVIILKVIGTQDAVWVDSTLKSFDKTKIDYISYNQILNKGLQL
jgi:superfamily II DNA or RNA helicase